MIWRYQVYKILINGRTFITRLRHSKSYKTHLCLLPQNKIWKHRWSFKLMPVSETAAHQQRCWWPCELLSGSSEVPPKEVATNWGKVIDLWDENPKMEGDAQAKRHETEGRGFECRCSQLFLKSPILVGRIIFPCHLYIKSVTVEYYMSLECGGTA